ncbi:MAG: 50S ribosomal protein L4 [Dethiobacteria bacterium]|nr:50S ribosomal protein L4 [Bacillota bacterium]MDW7729428.1 50S ribosomal protein L4 [Bacillota bacterium]
MPKLSLYNRDGDQVEEIDLNEGLFAAPFKQGALHQTVVTQAARRRLGTASSKDRSEVRGGGAKPWPQKGTGRARHGSTRSPLWAGGGVTFGPHPRDFNPKVPKKMRRAALKTALSDKVNEGKLILINEYAIDTPQTKKMVALLDNLKISGGALIVIDQPDLNIIKAARNLPRVKTVLARQLNVLDILTYNYLVMNKAALQQVEEVFGG